MKPIFMPHSSYQHFVLEQLRTSLGAAIRKVATHVQTPTLIERSKKREKIDYKLESDRHRSSVIW